MITTVGTTGFGVAHEASTSRTTESFTSERFMSHWAPIGEFSRTPEVPGHNTTFL